MSSSLITLAGLAEQPSAHASVPFAFFDSKAISLSGVKGRPLYRIRQQARWAEEFFFFFEKHTTFLYSTIQE
jgi:hypothetical protein